MSDVKASLILNIIEQKIDMKYVIQANHYRFQGHL